MSAVTGTRPIPAQARPGPATAAGPVTRVRVIRAELTKLRGLRSTWWCALIAVVLIVGLGAAIAGSAMAYHVSPGNSAATAVSAALLGVLFAQLVVGVLGVLAFSGEYGTGMIRATLAVVPSRLPVLWAKLIVLAGLVLPVSLLCVVIDFFTAWTPVENPGTRPLRSWVFDIGCALVAAAGAFGSSSFAQAPHSPPPVLAVSPHARRRPDRHGRTCRRVRRRTGLRAAAAARLAGHRPARSGLAVPWQRPPRRRGGPVISVLLVDDHALIRMGFRLVLDAEADIEVAGEAADGIAAVSMCSALRPDVVLMDIRMPGHDGIEATRDIVAAGLPSKVLILTTFDLDDYVYDGLRAGGQRLPPEGHPARRPDHPRDATGRPGWGPVLTPWVGPLSSRRGT